MSNAVLNGLAGAGGGIIAQIITYPLQTVILSLFYLLHLLQCFVLSRNCEYLSKLDEKKLNLGCRLILGSRLRGLLRLRVKQINPLLLLIEALVAVPWFNSYRFHLLPPLIWPRHICIHVGKCSGRVKFCKLIAALSSRRIGWALQWPQALSSWYRCFTGLHVAVHILISCSIW